MDILGNANPPVVSCVLFIAPIQSCIIQIGHIPEHAPNEEVFLYEPHETFHLALRKGMPGLAELRLESNGLHELLIVLLPDWIAIQVTPNDYALHVIRQDVLRNAHVAESVDHPNEQIFLLCIGEELHIPLPAVVANHSEAGGVVFTSIVCLYLRKAPVHLKRLSGTGRVPSPTVSLRFNCMTRGGNKMMVGRDVVLDDGFTTSESALAKFIKAHDRVYNACFEQTIQNAGVATQESGCGLAALQCVLDILKVMSFHAAQFGAGNACTTSKVREVDFFQRELVSLFSHYLLYSFCYYWIHGCKVRFLHDSSFHRGLAT